MRRLLRACVVGAEVAVAAQAGAVATVRGVREITTPARTQLIVECSAPVRHRLRLVAAQPRLGVPVRLYVDLIGAQLSDAAALPSAFREGPLVRLRATQGGAVTRLILDVPDLEATGAFPLYDPFRLLIDIRGRPRPAAPAETGNGPAVVAPSADPHATTQTATAVGAPQPRAPQRPARPRFKIVVDPGHGGKDPGALGVGGAAEKDVVLAMAQRLKTRLEAEPALDVVLTRDQDIFLSLEERTARANAERADLFVSIHANASEDTSLSGVETYYLKNTNDHATIRLAEMENGLRTVTGHSRHDYDASFILSDLIQRYKVDESAALAEQIQRAVVGTLNARGMPVNNLGVKRGPFYVLVGAGMPCVLVETGFITHAAEGRRVTQEPYQEAVAEGLLRGIRRFVENARVATNL